MLSTLGVIPGLAKCIIYLYCTKHLVQGLHLVQGYSSILYIDILQIQNEGLLHSFKWNWN